MARIEEDLLGTREVPDDAYWGIHAWTNSQSISSKVALGQASI